MSNFILTGHMGLIGSFLLKRLTKEGHNLVALIDLRAGTDIRDICMMPIYEEIDVMYHLASFCKITDCIKEPHLAFQHNVLGTSQVMEVCRWNGIPKIVFTSSTRVLYPEKNPYTASKLYGEEIIKAYSESYGIDYTIIRPSTVYGPFNDLTNRLVHRWINNAIKDEPLKIFGTKDKTLDFTYVDDFVEALLKASRESNKEFNVGSGQETKLEDVAQFIIDQVGSGQIEYHPAEKLQPQNVVVDTDIECPTDWKVGIQKNIDFLKEL